MAANSEKYYYINRVGLTRDSWAHKKFEEDAARHHMEDQPGKLVALRLTEYYELLERLGGVWPVPGAGIAVPTTNGAIASRAMPSIERNNSTSKAEGKNEESTENSDQTLDDSIDYWTNL